jgi:hypothetical protein
LFCPWLALRIKTIVRSRNHDNFDEIAETAPEEKCYSVEN